MKQYAFTIREKTPLLMHYDNLQWQERIKRWQIDPSNQAASVKGDDRSPAWTWIGSAYSDSNVISLPSDNLMRALMEGGQATPTGKGQKTYKAQTQSGMLVHDEYVPLLIDGKPVDYKGLLELEGETDFAKHEAAAVERGFVLYTKKVRMNGRSRNIRVRPRFDRWELRGVLDVWDPQLTASVLGTILSVAGKDKGLGDWRPSSKTPGPFGTFGATITEVR